MTLESPDGSARTDSVGAGVVVLHFWATWCPPCRTELPDLLRLFRTGRTVGGVRFIAVAMDRDWQAVSDFFDGNIPPEVTRDGSARAAESYRVTTLPDTYVVVNGVIRYRVAGAREWRSKDAARFMTSLSGIAPP